MKTSVLTSGDFLSVSISGFDFKYHRWVVGEKLLGKFIAIDTETEQIKGDEIPSLALATASSDRQHVLIHPDDVGEFLLIHPQVEVVCHNAAFDFWVIHKHLVARADTEALQVWLQLVAERRLHDTMLMDILLRLSGGGGANRNGRDSGMALRNLADVVLEYSGLEISKDDPYRLRFGELIGQDWSNVDPGFFEYAIKDAVCTLIAYREMRDRAIDVMGSQGYTTAKKARYDIYPDAVQRFGLLSEAIQVEGAIALSSLSRNGLHTNTVRFAAAEADFSSRFESVVSEIRCLYPEVFRIDKSGNLLRTKCGNPQISYQRLDDELRGAVEQIREQTGKDIIAPQSKSGNISHAIYQWLHLRELHPFLKLWVDYEKLAKRKQFFEHLRQPVIHPRYTPLVRTGRSSCSSPNMQQIPRDDIFRQVIVPSPGHLLLTVDYSCVELVTLAAVCEARFGYSKLGDVIRNGIDPHCYTAAILADVSLKQFMTWKQTDAERFKRDRQQAKPVNFGVPGGMGSAALVEYAKLSYGVEMTKEQAETFHRRLTKTIYPEMGAFLAEGDFSRMARVLNVPEALCMEKFCSGNMSPSSAAVTIKKIVCGKPTREDGRPYNANYVSKMWDILIEINRNQTLAADLRARIGSPELAACIFSNAAVTLTGRVRTNVSYTQSKNTPFQSLASDGAKRALGRLVLGGYRVVGFIHDEILIELPDQGDYVDLSVVKAVVNIMCDSMQEMTGSVPVKCEYTLSDRWSKNAELIIEGDKVRPWRPKVLSICEA